jgi:hypothetical protein
MKNIHLLPTEKPSRLCIHNSCNELNYFEVAGLSTEHIINQHIYITSDEEIKEGDYVYSIKQGYNIQNVPKGLVKSYQEVEHYKKIILTTDQELIDDGVQSIDDEFLEWFVKNPTREFVEIIIPQEKKLSYIEATKKEERIFNSTMTKQAERMYSEEEVLEILIKCPHGYSDARVEWFERFKKK